MNNVTKHTYSVSESFVTGYTGFLNKAWLNYEYDDHRIFDDQDGLYGLSNHLSVLQSTGSMNGLTHLFMSMQSSQTYQVPVCFLPTMHLVEKHLLVCQNLENHPIDWFDRHNLLSKQLLQRQY